MANGYIAPHGGADFVVVQAGQRLAVKAPNFYWGLDYKDMPTVTQFYPLNASDINFGASLKAQPILLSFNANVTGNPLQAPGFLLTNVATQTEYYHIKNGTCAPVLFNVGTAPQLMIGYDSANGNGAGGNAAAPTLSTSVTITPANLANTKAIISNPAAGITLTVPDSAALVAACYWNTGDFFDWTIRNTNATNSISIAGNGGSSFLSGTVRAVAPLTEARFRTACAEMTPNLQNFTVSAAAFRHERLA